MPRKRTTRRRRQHGGAFMNIQPYPMAVQGLGAPMAGAGFVEDFANGFMTPFRAVSSIIPGGLSGIASKFHPAAGAAARMLGLGRRRAPRRTMAVRL